LIAHFRAPMDKRGLIPAIEQAIERFRRNSDIRAFLQLEWNDTKLPAEIEIQVLRIVQEALVNIRKHSEANAVRVLMRAERDKHYMVMIEDDGIGIQNKIMEGGPGEHLGLNILQERATRIGGDLKIGSPCVFPSRKSFHGRMISWKSPCRPGQRTKYEPARITGR
jgi:two-component system nitrate/nitrite sensor histidine kinase NarX